MMDEWDKVGIYPLRVNGVMRKEEEGEEERSEKVRVAC